MESENGGASTPPPRPVGKSRPGLVMLGVVLTLAALGSIAVGLPSAVPLSDSGFGFLALGAAGLFFGGNLLGLAVGLGRGARA